MAFCESCGGNVEDSDRFCPSCGHAAPPKPPPAAPAPPPAYGKAFAVLILLFILAIVAVALIRTTGGAAPLVFATNDGIYCLTSSSGEPQQIVDAEDIFFIQPSPNGRWIAYLTAQDNPETGELSICDLRGRILKTSSGDEYAFAEWAPNSSGVAAVARRSDGESGGIDFLDLRKGSDPESLVSASRDPMYFRWSPDGRNIAFMTTDNELEIAAVRGGEDARRVADLSPDDTYMLSWLSADEIAYLDEGGDLEAYSLSSSKTRRLLSEDDARELAMQSRQSPAVSRNGLNAALLGAQSGYPTPIQAELERGDDAHFFELDLEADTTYVVIVGQDAVALDIIKSDETVLATGERDDDMDVVMATLHSERSETAYARVRPAEGESSADYSIWAISSRPVEGPEVMIAPTSVQSSDSGGARGGLNSFRGQVPSNATYTFEGRGNQSITIDVTSDDLDTVVELFTGRSAGGESIGRDDDGGDGTNSRLSTYLPRSGPYTAQVTSYYDGGGGAFNLTVEGPGVMTAPTSVQSSDSGGARGGRHSLRGQVPGNDTYTFEGRGNQSITIDVTSNDLDTVVELFTGRSAGGESIGRDDDGGGGTNSRLYTYLPRSGPYTAQVTSYYYGGGGAFNLTVEGPGVMIAPTSMDDAWPLPVSAGGLWAGVSSLEAYSDQPPSLSLLAVSAVDATPAVWTRNGSEFALIFTPSRDAQPSDRRGTPQLALVAASGGAPTVQPIEPLRGHIPRLLAWNPDGSILALWANEEDSGDPSIWLIPARRPADARRLEKDVRCFSWGGLGSEEMISLSWTEWLQ